jgi:hypothetical protein
MRIPFMALCVAVAIISGSQRVSAQLRLIQTSFTSGIKRMTADTAEKALKIASYLINSQEFRDSVSKFRFPWKNRCARNSKDSINGSEILFKIFANSTVALTLELDSSGKKPNFETGNCRGLAVTNVGKHHVRSYYENIMCSMGDSLPFSWGYATHLTHEFSHDVGFCHTTQEVETDLAEAIGEIAYYYLNRWYWNPEKRKILDAL